MGLLLRQHPQQSQVATGCTGETQRDLQVLSLRGQDEANNAAEENRSWDSFSSWVEISLQQMKKFSTQFGCKIC